MSLAPAIESLRARIEKASAGSPLASRPVTLLAAAKGQPASLVEEAITAGITDFGENRVQEAAGKWPALKQAHPRIALHLIGPLQTNKVKEALRLFDVIQTIDRPKLALAIAKELERWRGGDVEKRKSGSPHPHITTSPHRFFIQVNTGDEPQKAGVAVSDADALIKYCRDTLRLPVVGLMCIPPAGQPPAPHFALLRQIAQRHGLTELSMGMSEDFETAVRMGSTCVRIGRALFGERNAETRDTDMQKK